MTPCQWRPPVAATIALALVTAARAGAQGLPSRPIELAEGQVVVSGTVSASVADDDSPGYFNVTDYDHSALRLFSAAITAAWQPVDRLAVLADVRTENLDTPRVSAAYVRVRPWIGRAVDIQAGRIPPSFGAFARRGYALDNPLIGYPLAYQYLTTLRADALPATADDLLAQRGRGWRVRYPIGDPTPDAGVPLVSAFRWDTGVQVRVGTRPIEATAAVTLGTLSNPRVTSENDGPQVSGRLALRPTAGFVLGVSAARGPFVTREATAALPAHASGDTPTQQAFGVDAEYSRGHWILRGEVVFSSWSLPVVDAPHVTGRLEAVGAWVEGRYRVTPRVYVAARADHLGFSKLAGTLFGGQPTPWDAAVTRLEAGGGYFLLRNVVARAVYQRNWRDGGRPTRRHFVAAQIVYWF